MVRKLSVLLWIVFLLAGAKILGAQAEKDFGKEPYVVNIEELTLKNEYFRSAKWTGQYLQLTVMTLKPGEEIGLEVHEKGDQFIRVEQGTARVVMGKTKDKMTFDKRVSADWAIFIPAGYWHNVINVGDKPLKIYVIYAPPEHPAGTLHKTSKDAKAAHGK